MNYYRESKYDIHREEEKRRRKRWWKKKENFWIFIGFLIVSVAVYMPFRIIAQTKSNGSLESFEKLGVVGDFFGGTTVGLLSLASILFVTAAIVMQKEELSLQREEVEKTRQEYEITNITMKKQQFDSIFFNMIDLHHRITNKLNYIDQDKNNTNGNEVFKLIIRKLEVNYEENFNNIPFLKRKVQRSIVDAFIKNFHIQKKQNEYISEINNSRIRKIFGNDKLSYEQRQNRIEEYKTEFKKRFDLIVSGKEKEWTETRSKEEERLEALLKNLKERKELLSQVLLNKEKNKKELVEDFLNDYFKSDLFISKKDNFRMTVDIFGVDLDQYLKNLYQILKLVEEEDFSISSNKYNQNIKNQYKQILGAQLSKNELLFLFYNAIYSKKDHGFKKILSETNFLEIHLEDEDLIFETDIIEMRAIKI